MSTKIKVRNQHEDVLEYLKTHDGITQKDAWTVFPAPITRLSAIIFDLRKKYNIESIDCVGINCYGKNNYVKYTLKKEN